MRRQYRGSSRDIRLPHGNPARRRGTEAARRDRRVEPQRLVNQAVQMRQGLQLDGVGVRVQALDLGAQLRHLRRRDGQVVEQVDDRRDDGLRAARDQGDEVAQQPLVVVRRVRIVLARRDQPAHRVRLRRLLAEPQLQLLLRPRGIDVPAARHERQAEHDVDEPGDGGQRAQHRSAGLEDLDGVVALFLDQHVEGAVVPDVGHHVEAEELEVLGYVEGLARGPGDDGLEDLRVVQNLAFLLLEGFDAEALVPYSPSGIVGSAGAGGDDGLFGQDVVVPGGFFAFGAWAVDCRDGFGSKDCDFIGAWDSLLSRLNVACRFE